MRLAFSLLALTSLPVGLGRGCPHGAGGGGQAVPSKRLTTGLGVTRVRREVVLSCPDLVVLRSIASGLPRTLQHLYRAVGWQLGLPGLSFSGCTLGNVYLLQDP